MAIDVIVNNNTESLAASDVRVKFYGIFRTYEESIGTVLLYTFEKIVGLPQGYLSISGSRTNLRLKGNKSKIDTFQGTKKNFSSMIFFSIIILKKCQLTSYLTVV